jgi:peroxiredoxin
VVTASDGARRSRVEIEDDTSGGVTVSDGETTWVYLPHQRKYTRLSAMPIAGAAGAPAAGGIDFSAAARRFISRYRGASSGLLQAAMAGEEAIDVGGGRQRCQVVEAEYEPPPGVTEGRVARKYWIDPESALILREVSQASMKSPQLSAPVVVDQTIEFRVANAKPGLPDDLFVFHPPPGVEEVASLDPKGAPETRWVGKPAPDFALKDLQGRTVRLQDLRGQVVLLDFWATWCTPCRAEMPRVDALYSEFKEKGLRVYGVNGEPEDVARAYLEKASYGYPTLVDPGMQVAQRFQVGALPTTIVIDREGKVAAYSEGANSAAHLRQMIRRAGID